jgi:hypothetical protein
MGHAASAFTEPTNTASLTCAHVLAGAPILFVSHDVDGGWQFLCGASHTVEEGRIVGIGHMVRDDPSLNALAHMCPGDHAERQTGETAWRVIDGHEDFIRSHVADGGWALTGIPAGASGEPAFVYTTGLFHNFKQPELIVLGLRMELMQAMLNELGRRIKDGEAFAEGQRVSDVIGNFDVKLHAVRDAKSFKEHVGYACWFYEGNHFPLLQVVYPDLQGRFPGEPGTAAAFARQQPVLP